MQQPVSSDDKPVRFGVLGTGRITRRLVADLQQSKGISVAAIASRDGARAKWYADQFGIPHGFAGYDALLSSESVDAVYVALPPALHLTWAQRAAEAGKHILCEKPLAIDWSQAIALDRACCQAGVCWLDATAWVHHPRSERMQRVLQAGQLGQLRHVTASVSFYEPFQSGDHRLQAELGGGCLLDLGWYAVGATIWAAGSAHACRVVAQGQRREGVWYRASGLIEFSRGLTASVQCGYDLATRKWMEVAGENASLICDDFTRPWTQRPARFWVHDRAGDVTSETCEGYQEQAMIQALREEICGIRKLDSCRQQALATQRVLTALEESLQTGRAVELETPSCENAQSCD